MHVGEVMQRGVTTVRPTDSIRLAGQIMAWAEVKHLPVVERGQLVGMLSERDLLRHQEAPASTLVEAAMAQPVRTAQASDEVSEVMRRLVDERIGCLPVMEGQTLVGIVTRGDLLALQAYGELSTSAPSRMRASSIMTSEPHVAHLDDYLLDALARMNQASVRHLPVVDGELRCIGMLSDRDVRRAVGDLSAMVGTAEVRTRVSLARVGDVASRAPMTVSAEASLIEIASLMSRFRVGAIPVVDREQRLIGIVSYLDVIGALTGERSLSRETSPEARPELH